MRALDEEEYVLEAEPAFRKVFVSSNPMGEPFSPLITKRMIIYRYHFVIDPPLSDAVVKAALSLGDIGFYWTQLWRPKQAFDEILDCFIYFSEFEELYIKNNKNYDELRPFFMTSNAMYSPQGKWGIMFSGENYALLGGTQEFVDSICQDMPNVEQQVYDLMRYWRNWKNRYPHLFNVPWLPNLLKHIYGEESTQNILEELYLSDAENSD